jgi:hypothetical protein
VIATNGAGPPRRGLGSRLSRRARLLIGGCAALVILGVLVAPVVILTNGSTGGKHCSLTLLYKGRRYVARPVASASVVEGVAIGIGVTSGCGAAPSNINIRSLVGVKPTAAVGVPGDAAAIYVRRGVCSQASARGLLGCVSSRG